MAVQRDMRHYEPNRKLRMHIKTLYQTFPPLRTASQSIYRYGSQLSAGIPLPEQLQLFQSYSGMLYLSVPKLLENVAATKEKSFAIGTNSLTVINAAMT